MKKWIAILLIVVSLFALAGCGKTGDCESCGKKDVSLEEVEYEGESAYLCEECAGLIEGLADLAGSLGDLGDLDL